MFLGLSFYQLCYFSLRDRILNPVARRQPLRLHIFEDSRGFIGFLGSVVRLDYHFCRSCHFTTDVFNYSLMPFAIVYLVVYCWCHRCFHSNFSQSKHHRIPCCMIQLSKDAFLMLQLINNLYLLPSNGTILASNGSRFNQISVFQFIITCSFL